MKTLTASTPYGYQELRQVHHRYMMLAMFMAISVQMMVIGAYRLSEWLKQDDTINVPPQRIPFELLPLPPSLTNPMPNIGTPQPNISNPTNQNVPGFEGMDNGNVIVIPPDPLPTVFIAFEKPPEPVFKAFPEYPDVAKRTGLEGTVIVQVLLNKEGKVKKALVAKTNNEIFSEASLEAAQKWVFTPALMQGKPVTVWITIPFRFRLTGK
jgi:TonB family protein